MSPQTMLMQMSKFGVTWSIYMTKAALTDDPVERMKYVMSANFSWFFYEQAFRKPLNPILGETYEA